MVRRASSRPFVSLRVHSPSSLSLSLPRLLNICNIDVGDVCPTGRARNSLFTRKSSTHIPTFSIANVPEATEITRKILNTQGGRVRATRIKGSFYLIECVWDVGKERERERDWLSSLRIHRRGKYCSWMDLATEIELQLRNDVIKLTLALVARAHPTSRWFLSQSLLAQEKEEAAATATKRSRLFSLGGFNESLVLALSTGREKQRIVIRGGNAGYVYRAQHSQQRRLIIHLEHLQGADEQWIYIVVYFFAFFVSVCFCFAFFPLSFFFLFSPLSGTYNRAAAENGSSDTAIVGRRDKLTPHTSSFVSEMPRVLLRNHLFFSPTPISRIVSRNPTFPAAKRNEHETAEVSSVVLSSRRLIVSIVRSRIKLPLI